MAAARCLGFVGESRGIDDEGPFMAAHARAVKSNVM